MKRYISLILAAFMAVSLTACQTASGLFHNNLSPESSTQVSEVGEDDVRVGFIFPYGSDSPDTISHVAAIRRMQQAVGLSDSQIDIVRNVSSKDYADQIEKLISQGCDLIFAKKSDAENAMIEAAKNHPEVEFCQEDGRKAEDSGLSNMHNFYVRLYQGYYAAGVAAGVKLNSMLNEGKIYSETCVAGFAAASENPENISSINAFTLGVRRVCYQARVLVRYVGKVGDYDADGECARQLIAAGAHLMCQRVFTNAVAVVCAENDIPVVGNETNIIDVAPSEAITSVTADWSVYYEYAVSCLLNGKEIDTDWCAGYKENAVVLSQFNDAHLAEGTIEKVVEVEQELRSGRAKVYDTTTFTVNGETLENLVKSDSAFKKFKKLVANGEFKESRNSSAPKMNFLIDGVQLADENYLPEEETTEEGEETSQAEQ
ncbi:MAG: BMP family ABC transporter substrate-binding protein [Eubacterium sp.]|nr:BMP family ABC transporter substrate-binding protein [Eubacterium sp.]